MEYPETDIYSHNSGLPCTAGERPVPFDPSGYGRTYPGLGIDRDDPRSVSAAIRFLDENRETLRILSDRYDVDKVIKKYQPCMQ